MDQISQFLQFTAILNLSWGNLLMDAIAIIFIYLAIKKHYEPLLLVPIGIGILLGNVVYLLSLRSKGRVPAEA